MGAGGEIIQSPFSLPLTMPKKITFYEPSGQPHEDQILMAVDWTPLQILQYHEAYKAWHTKAFGETEAQRRTKGKKIVIWDPEHFKS